MREQEAGPVDCVQREDALVSKIFYLPVRRRMRGAAASCVCGFREAIFQCVEPDVDRV